MSSANSVPVLHADTGAAWDLLDLINALITAPSYHLIFEVILILVVIRLFFSKSYKPFQTELTKQEKQELIDDWMPEPLVPETDPNDPTLLNYQNRLVEGKVSKYVQINGSKCLNMATFNFLGMIGRQEIEQEAIKSLHKYGVGSCGPRGFYGTVDVHIDMEEELARFMGVEETILYSYGFPTMASAIPAYSKRGDIIFCDEGVNFSIQKGIQASRSKVYWFKHNDMADLEDNLKLVKNQEKKNPKKAKVTRKFLIVEGLYTNFGDIAPLQTIIDLKWKYKVRLFIDETMSFGTLGQTGRGITEHFGINIREVDMISASQENSLGSIGGFCCGSTYVIDHQRLSGQGYCFSASQPPMLVTAAKTALQILEKSPHLLSKLHENSIYAHRKLSNIEQIRLVGDEVSPIKHVQLSCGSGDSSIDTHLLRQVVQKAQEQNVAFTVASYLVDQELFTPTPSIRLTVNSELTVEEIDLAVNVLENAFKIVVKS